MLDKIKFQSHFEIETTETQCSKGWCFQVFQAHDILIEINKKKIYPIGDLD